MKKITLLLTCLLNLSFAQAATLTCSPGTKYDNFTAQIQVYESGLFNLEQAKIESSYYSKTELICDRHSDETEVCLGFWGLSRNRIVKVEIKNHQGILSASFGPLKGFGFSEGPWPCVIKK